MFESLWSFISGSLRAWGSVFRSLDADRERKVRSKSFLARDNRTLSRRRLRDFGNHTKMFVTK